jgi:hypothetical protein
MRLFFIAISIATLSACSTVVPIKQDWPAVPAELLIPPVKLKTIDKPNAKASDLLSTVNENYGLYHELAAKLIGWQQWYQQQKQIQEQVK